MARTDGLTAGAGRLTSRETLDSVTGTLHEEAVAPRADLSRTQWAPSK